MSTAKEKFDAWALVELFGHQRIVGRVTEQAIGGASFIRVDVPDPSGSVRFTRLYGAAAIYAISPIDRETAIALAQRCEAEPVKSYELPQLAERTGWTEDDEGGEDDGEDGGGDEPALGTED